jgi:hypothetical protein
MKEMIVALGTSNGNVCITITILDIIHFLFKARRFGDWILSPSSGENYWAQ